MFSGASMGSTAWAAASAVLCGYYTLQYGHVHMYISTAVATKVGLFCQCERLVLGVLCATMQTQYGCLTTCNEGLMCCLAFGTATQVWLYVQQCILEEIGHGRTLLPLRPLRTFFGGP